MPIKLDVLGFFQWVLGMALCCLCTDLKILGSEALFFFFFGTEQDIVGHALEPLGAWLVLFCLLSIWRKQAHSRGLVAIGLNKARTALCS